MADFDTSFNKTMKDEGGYSNNLSDRGLETYCGISRRFYPAWPGWTRIDAIKYSPDFHDIIKQDAALKGMVRDFYRKEFWNAIRGDGLKSQSIADELFDEAVNMGTFRAVLFLQRALNALNRHEDLYPDLIEDGKLGGRTLNALDYIIERGESELLYKMLNVQQGAFYLDLMKNDHTQKTFCRGWFSRVTFLKS
jgi:lysozyme family protein